MEIDRTLTYDVNGKKVLVSFSANYDKTFCKYTFKSKDIIDPQALAFLLYYQAVGLTKQVGGRIMEFTPKEHIKI